MGKLRIGLIFGGRSVEHDVSLVSARAVLEHLDPEKFDVVPIGVTRQGRWLTSRDAGTLLERGLGGESGEHVVLSGDPGIRGLIPMMMIVCPRSLSSASSAMTLRCWPRSSPVVGSSMMMSEGSQARTEANASL